MFFSNKKSRHLPYENHTRIYYFGTFLNDVIVKLVTSSKITLFSTNKNRVYKIYYYDDLVCYTFHISSHKYDVIFILQIMNHYTCLELSYSKYDTASVCLHISTSNAYIYYFLNSSSVF